MIKFSELNTTKRCEGLVPAIIQDDNTRQVLMLGYMNEEAYDKTSYRSARFVTRERKPVSADAKTKDSSASCKA